MGTQVNGNEVDNTTETTPLKTDAPEKQNGSQLRIDVLRKHKDSERSIGSSTDSLATKKKRFYRHGSFDLHHHNSIIKLPTISPIQEQFDASKVPWWTSQRFFLAIICFCGFSCLYAQRVNLSIAIVSMVDHSTELEIESNTSINHNLSMNYSTSGYTVYTDDINNTELSKCPKAQKSDTKKGEFHWNKKLQGMILGSFFWGYLILQVPGGWLSEKFGAKKVIAAGMFPVAILSILTPVCARANPYLFIVIRVVLGLGESVMYPSVQALWANWSPPSERSRLIGLSYAGGQFGNALIFPIGGFLCHYGFDGGWPSVFYIIGSLGFLWCIFWCIFVYDTPAQNPWISTIEKEYIEHSLHVTKSSTKKGYATPWKSIFTSKAVWAIIVGHVCGNYGIYMLLTQLPTYMKEVLKFDIKSNGVFSMLPYLLFWLMIILSGILADYFIRKKILTTANTRKLVSVIGTVLPGIFLIATSYMECYQQMLAVAMITLAVGLCGFHISGFFINHSDIAPRFAGTLFGITNTLATIPGILAPYIVGALTVNGSREEWQLTFYIAAGVYFFGAIFYTLTGEGKVQSWAKFPEDLEATEEDGETMALTDTTKVNGSVDISANGKHPDPV